MWKTLFRKRKAQTIMIFFVVLFCTILLNGSMTILTSLDEPYDQLKKECKSPDVNFYTYTNDANYVSQYAERFEQLEGVKQVVSVPYTYLDDEVYVGDQKIKAFIDLVKYDKEAYKQLRYVEGSHDIEKELEAGKCYIPACVQIEYHLNVGDVLTIKNSHGDINFEIAGVFAEPFSTSTAFDGVVLAKQIPKELTKIQYCVKIFAKNGYNGEDIERAYQKQYTGILPGYIETVDSRISGGLIAVHITAGIFLAIGVIMLVVSGLIINFMVRQAMFTDAKNIAVYKTIGYRTGTILNMYLTFYFVVVSVASILGVFGSKILAGFVLHGLFENLGQATSVHVERTGIGCALAVIAFVLGIVFSVIIKTKNVKPVYALNGLTNSNTKKHKYHGGSKIAFSPFSIAIRNIRRDKKGAIGIVITTIVTIFAINFAMISLDVAVKQKDNNDYWIGVDASDVIINVPNSDKYSEVEKLVQSDDRVDHYLNISQNERVLLDWDDINVAPGIAAFIYDDFRQVDLPVVEGRNPESASEIAIGAKVAKDHKKEVGDYLECYIGNEKKVNFLIVGIYQTYYQMGDTCRLCSSVYSENHVKTDYNMCSIYLKNSSQRSAFMKDMEKKVGNRGEVIKRTEAFSSIMDMIVAPQIKGIPPITVLSFIIGAINIFCIVMLKNASNEKNNEIYKSIGYATNDLIQSNIFYVGIIALVSTMIAVPLTLWAYPGIMSNALSIFGFRTYPMEINAVHLILANAVAFLIFIVSTLISSSTLRRINVRDLVIE